MLSIMALVVAIIDNNKAIRTHFVNFCIRAYIILAYIGSKFLEKFIFIFTSYFYRKKIISSIKKYHKNIYETRITDLQYQVSLLEAELTRYKDVPERHLQDDAYSKGVKYGYSLCEKKYTEKNSDGNKLKMNDTHRFTLHQISKKNSSVSGLIASSLEDRGFVNLVWDNKDNNKYHYEITEKGTKYLKKWYPEQNSDAELFGID